MVDHAALAYLHKGRNTKLTRWALRLEEFSYEPEYRPGRQHGNVDGLSRLPAAPALEQQEECMEQGEMAGKQDNIRSTGAVEEEQEQQESALGDTPTIYTLQDTVEDGAAATAAAHAAEGQQEDNTGGVQRTAAEEVTEDTACELCGSPSNEAHMVLCDHCNKGFHNNCMAQEDKPKDDGNWYCRWCVREDDTLDATDPAEDLALHHLLREGDCAKEWPKSEKDRVRKKAGNYEMAEDGVTGATGVLQVCY